MLVKSVFAALSLLAAVLLALVGCDGGGRPPGFDIYVRDVSVGVVPLSSVQAGVPLPVTGEAPLEVLPSFTIHAKSADPHDRRYGEVIEIDYGDGSGWVDITALVHAKQRAEDEGETLPLSLWLNYSYTYQEPGEYMPRLRVSWWDGEVTYSRGTSYSTVIVLPPEGSGGEPSGGGDPEDDEWEIVSFTDPRDGSVYDIIDGRALIAFRLPLDQAAAEQFLADMELTTLSEWWEVGCVGVLLPEGVSVLEAVSDWPAQHPELIESVDPDTVVEAEP